MTRPGAARLRASRADQPHSRAPDADHLGSAVGQLVADAAVHSAARSDTAAGMAASDAIGLESVRAECVLARLAIGADWRAARCRRERVAMG